MFGVAGNVIGGNIRHENVEGKAVVVSSISWNLSLFEDLSAMTGSLLISVSAGKQCRK